MNSLSRLLLVLLLPLSGACRPAGGNVEATSETGPAAGFPRTEQTFGDATLELLDRPVRILPANGGALDFVLAVCDPERVVALSPVALEYSVGAHELGLAPALGERATLGEWSAESALSLDPDLVVMGEWQSEKIFSVLRRANVPVLRLPDVTSFEDVLEIVEVLGRVVGEEERANAEVSRLRARAAEMNEPSRREELGLRALSYSNFGSGGSTAGSGTTYDTMIRLAHLENAARTAGIEGFGSLSLEALLTIDPDWIVLGVDAADPGLGASERTLREDPNYESVRAIREGRILRLEGRLYSTNSQWLVEAAHELRTQIEAWSPPTGEADGDR